MPTRDTRTLVPGFDEIATSLKAAGHRRVRQSSSGVTLCCPYHDDTNPSLSVFLTSRGALGWKCHTGCRIDRAQWEQLMRDAGAWVEAARAKQDYMAQLRVVKSRRGTPQTLRSIQDRHSAIYTYSETLIKARRHAKNAEGAPFAFMWFHRDEDGDWYAGAGGQDIPLYHADDLAERAELPVLIMEGEKDCDNARGCVALQAGYVIISLPHGASGRITPSQLRALEGRDVWVCYDLDEAGQRGQRLLAQALAAGGARPRVIRPSVTTQDGKDFSNWLDVHGEHGAAALIMSAARQPYEPPPPPASDPVIARVVTKDSHGLQAALRAMGMDFRYNTRASANEIRIGGLWLTFNERIQDDVRQRLATTFQHATGSGNRPLTFSREAWLMATNALAFKTEIDPFEAWLQSLPAWDGTPRLDHLLTTCFDADPADRLVVWTSRYLIGGPVTRTFQPGFKLDTLPILIGEQGIGKSTLLRELLPEHLQALGFSDTLRLDAPYKDQVESTLGAVIVEAPEMMGGSQANVHALKRFLSATTDRLRLAYRRDPEVLPRRCILVGTTNDNQCIPRDPSGNRRFVPVTVPSGNTEAIRRRLDADRDQLWAEAMAEYARGKRFYLHGALEREVDQRGGTHRIRDDTYDDLAESLDKTQPGTLLELALRCGLAERRTDGSIRPITRAQQMAFAAALRMCGWKPQRRRVSGQQVQMWKC